MLAITLFSAYLFFLALSAATAKGARSPIAMTERGSAVLVWLESHPKPGTTRSRAYVRRRFTRMVFNGLRLGRVIWGTPETGGGFYCIHRHEGTWNEHNDPYGGGLQEDRGFQRTYGSEFSALWGSAGYWPPWAQLVSAYRAHHGYGGYRARGWHPWPNTARYCGLLP